MLPDCPIRSYHLIYTSDIKKVFNESTCNIANIFRNAYTFKINLENNPEYDETYYGHDAMVWRERDFKAAYKGEMEDFYAKLQQAISSVNQKYGIDL